MQHARRLAIVLGFAIVGLGAGGQPAVAARAHAHHAASHAHAVAAKPKEPQKPVAPIHVATPLLLVDMVSGDVLHEENAEAPWHPASLTKLMTAYITFEAIAEGRLTLDSTVTMSAKAVSQAPAVSGLPAGDTLKLQDALYIMLVKSANDMAWAVAETVGGGNVDVAVAEMNATAAKLGLTRTHYDNPNGLPDEGQVTTARDLAVLAIDLRRTFPQYDPIFNTQYVTLGKAHLKSNNGLLTKFAGTTGMKTGYICASGLNILATVNRDGKQLMAVVLGGSSARERDEMTAQLLLRGLSGEYPQSGKSVVTIADDMQSAPTDMKPMLCGSKAKAYVAQRRAEFPMGLKGKPSYLTDKIAALSYTATDLGPVGGGPAGAIKPVDDNEPAQGDASGTDDSAAAPAVVAPAVVAPVPQPRLHRR